MQRIYENSKYDVYCISRYLYQRYSKNLFMPLTSKKLRGAYWFGPVCPSVRLSVRLSVPSVRLSVRNTFWKLRNSRTPYARILKFYIRHIHAIFFLRRSCHSGVMPLFRLCMNNLVSRISAKTAKARILIFGI